MYTSTKKMKKTSQDKKRAFYVVQFLELPSEDINDYVCVPCSWIVSYRLTDQNALVAYPKDIDPFETRNRAKRRERIGDQWGVYLAIIKYKSSTYQDAEYWITTKNNYGLINEEKSNMKDIQPEPVLDRKLRSVNQCSWLNSKINNPQLALKPSNNPRKPMMKISIKRPIQSKHQETIDEKQVELNKTPKSPSSIENYARMVPECSRGKQSIIIQEDQLIRSAQTEKTAATSDDRNNEQSTQPNRVVENDSSTEPDLSNTNQSISPQLTSDEQPSIVSQEHQQKQSVPVINVTEPTEMINISQEVQPDSDTEKRPSSNETPQNTSEQHCQPEFVFKKPNPTIWLENQLQQPLLQGTSAGQSTEDTGNNQETQLHSIIIDESKKVPKFFNRDKQPSLQYQLNQLPYSPAIINSFSNSQLKKIDVGRLTEVIRDDQGPRSFDITNDTSSTSNHVPTSVDLFTQLYEKVQNKPSLSVTKNPINKKTHRKMKARNISTAGKSTSKSKIQPKLLLPPTAKQASTTAQNHWQEVPQGPVMFAGSRTERSDIDPRFFFQGITNNSQEIQQASEKYFSRSNEINRLDQRVFNPDIASSTSATRKLSNLAHWTRCYIEQSYERLYLPTQRALAQPSTPVKDITNRSNEAQVRNQQVHIPNAMMNNAYFEQNQPNLVNQPSKLFPQHENQYLPINHMHWQEERLRQEQLRIPTEDTHTNHRPNPQNISISKPSAAQYSSNVLHQLSNDFEHSQKRQKLSHDQDSQRHLDTPRLQVGISVRANSESPKPGFQEVTSRTLSSIMPKASTVSSQSLLTAPRGHLLQDPRVQARLNQISMEQNNMNRIAFPPNNMEDSITVTQNFGGHSMSFDRSQKTQFTPVDENVVYQHPYKQKLIVDRSTHPEFTMEDIQFESQTDRSYAIESSPKVVDCACQVDDCTMEEPLSPYEEVISDNEVLIDDKIVSQQEVVSNHEMSEGVAPVEMVNNVDFTGETNLLQSNTEDKPTSAQNLVFSNQQMHTKTIEEQQMLNEFVTLLIQMSSLMSNIFDMFNNLRHSIVQSAETYQKLVEAAQTSNALGIILTTACPPSNVTSQVSQVSQERQTGRIERESHYNDDKNNNEVDSVPGNNYGRRQTYVFPPEYDPNDSKWTLKYKKLIPGLVELLPISGIYVNSSKLAYYNQISKDCKTLARLLLTEVFSMDALSVCSLTGETAKASNNVDIEVRPGLDEHARMVLLTFVEKYGLLQGWDTSDTQGTISSIRSQILEIRANYGQRTKS